MNVRSKKLRVRRVTTRIMFDQTMQIPLEQDSFTRLLSDSYRCFNDKERLMVWYAVVGSFMQSIRIVDRCRWRVKMNAGHKGVKFLEKEERFISIFNLLTRMLFRNNSRLFRFRFRDVIVILNNCNELEGIFLYCRKARGISVRIHVVQD